MVATKVGVFVDSTINPAPAQANTGANGRLIIAALTERGPVDAPAVLNNLNDFQNQLGTAIPYASTYQVASTFFAEGGTELVVARVVGPSATVGSLDLKAAAVTVATVKASSPGAWSAGLTVAVTKNGSSFDVTVAYQGQPVHNWRGLTSVADLVAKAANSDWVTVTPAAATGLPDTLVPTALSAGADDHSSATAQDYVDALNTVSGANYGGGKVAVPGLSADTTVGSGTLATALLAHCKANNRVALLAGPVDATTSDIKDLAQGLPQDDHLAVFWPWVVAADGTQLSPEAFAAGADARLWSDGQPAALPIASAGQAASLIGTVTPIGEDTSNDLLASGVNGIITSRLIGTQLYGWNSLSSDDNSRWVRDRDCLNAMVHDLRSLLFPFVGKVVDSAGTLVTSIDATVTGYLDREWATQLYAHTDQTGTVNPGYTVGVAPDLAGAINVAIQTWFSDAAQQINVNITKNSIQAL